LTLRGLRHATGFVQSKLAKTLQTRYTPVIQFVLDEGVKKSIELSRLLAAELGNGRTQADEAADENTTDERVSRPKSCLIRRPERRKRITRNRDRPRGNACVANLVME